MACGTSCDGGKHLRQATQVVELAWYDKSNVGVIGLPMRDVLGIGGNGERANNSPFGCACGACGKQYVGRTFGKGEPLQGILHLANLFGRGGSGQKHGHSTRNVGGEVVNEEVDVGWGGENNALSSHVFVVFGTRHSLIVQLAIGYGAVGSYHRHLIGCGVGVPFDACFNAKHCLPSFVEPSLQGCLGS